MCNLQQTSLVTAAEADGVSSKKNHANLELDSTDQLLLEVIFLSLMKPKHCWNVQTITNDCFKLSILSLMHENDFIHSLFNVNSSYEKLNSAQEEDSGESCRTLQHIKIQFFNKVTYLSLRQIHLWWKQCISFHSWLRILKQTTQNN